MWRRTRGPSAGAEQEQQGERLHTHEEERLSGSTAAPQHQGDGVIRTTVIPIPGILQGSDTSHQQSPHPNAAKHPSSKIVPVPRLSQYQDRPNTKIVPVPSWSQY